MLTRRETAKCYGLAVAGLAKGVYELAKEEAKSHPAALGWAALGASVLAFDYFSPQTLSEGVDTALDRSPLLTRLAIGYTALHLLNELPTQYDLFHQLHIKVKGEA